MKKIYNNILKAAPVLLLMFSFVFLAASFVNASNNQTSKLKAGAVEDKVRASYYGNTAASSTNISSAGKLYCDKIVALFPSIGQKISDFTSKLKDKRDQILSKINDLRQKRDAALKTARDNWAANRQEQFSALENKAQTSAQKQAVSKFESDTKNAIKARQQAVDTAIKAYRDGVDKLISDRRVAVDAAKTALKNSINAATDKAKADCSAGIDPKIIRNTLQASLKATREKYVSDVQSLEKARLSAMQQLLQTRQLAVKKALDDFRTTMEKLRADLKAVFGQATSDSSASSTQALP